MASPAPEKEETEKTEEVNETEVSTPSKEEEEEEEEVEADKKEEEEVSDETEKETEKEKEEEEEKPKEKNTLEPVVTELEVVVDADMPSPQPRLLRQDTEQELKGQEEVEKEEDGDEEEERDTVPEPTSTTPSNPALAGDKARRASKKPPPIPRSAFRKSVFSAEDELVGITRRLQQRVKDLQLAQFDMAKTNRKTEEKIAFLQRQATKFSKSEEDRVGRRSSIAGGKGRIHMSGWVQMEGGFLGWKKRFIRLYQYLIEVYSSDTEEKPSQVIDLHNQCRVLPLEERSGVKYPSIELAVPSFKSEKRYRFYAENEKENDPWYQNILNRIFTLKYVATCAEMGQMVDADFVRFLSQPLTATPTNVSFSDQELSKITVRYLSTVVSDAAFPAKPIAFFSAVNSSLSPNQAVEIISALTRRQKTTTDLIPAQLAVLDLSSNRLGGGSVPRAISDLLAVSASLKELVLNNCYLGDAGLITISHALPTMNCMLKRLSLRNNGITCEGVRELVQFLSAGRQSAPVRYKKTIDNGRYRLPTLETESAFRDASAAALEVEAVGVQQDVWQHTLEELDLSCNSIAEEGGLQLAKLIEANTAIKKLHLADNLLTDEGVRAICYAVREVDSLEFVDLSHNRFGIAGGKELLEMAQHTSTLSEVRFLNHVLTQKPLSSLRLLAQHGY